MVNPYEKQVMKDSTYIMRPVQKQFEEYFCHDVAGKFYSELYWKCCEVIVKNN